MLAAMPEEDSMPDDPNGGDPGSHLARPGRTRDPDVGQAGTLGLVPAARRLGRAFARLRPPGWVGVRARVAEPPLVKAAKILYEYTSTLYFPLNQVQVWQRAVLWPRLLLIEYLVYRADAITERNRDNDLDTTRSSDYELLYRYKRRFEQLLRSLGAWSATVAGLVDDGETFARLENALSSGTTATAADLRRIAELRPTDVRLLHAATVAMLGRADDAALRDALWPAEVLADIANDLEHYAQDVRNATFNLYAEYVNLYPSDAPDRLRETIDGYHRELAAKVDALPSARRGAVRDQCRALVRDRLDRIPPPAEDA